MSKEEPKEINKSFEIHASHQLLNALAVAVLPVVVNEFTHGNKQENADIIRRIFNSAESVVRSKGYEDKESLARAKNTLIDGAMQVLENVTKEEQPNKKES